MRVEKEGVGVGGFGMSGCSYSANPYIDTRRQKRERGKLATGERGCFIAALFPSFLLFRGTPFFATCHPSLGCVGFGG